MNPVRTSHFNSPVKDIQFFLGCVLALSSTGALVMTLQSLMNGWIAKALAIAAGIALQGCLYLFASHTHHRIRWFSSVLLVFSVVATTWFMEATWQQQQATFIQQGKKQASQSWQVEQLRQQITNLNRQIEINLNSANADTQNNFRQRGINTLSSQDDLYSRLNEAMEQLNAIQKAASTPPPVYSAMEVNTPVRLALFALIATIIDLSAILAFRHQTSGYRRVSEREDFIQQQGTRTNPESVTQNEPHNPIAALLARIRNGEYGEFVPVKQIVESEPVRHPELKTGLNQLIDEGVLVKSGNRYRHIGFNRQDELCVN